MKIIMAMTDENGLPEEGSFVAHCTLEFDEEALPHEDIDGFQRNVHAAIAACCRAIHHEVRRHARNRGAGPCFDRRFNGFWPAN